MARAVDHYDYTIGAQESSRSTAVFIVLPGDGAPSAQKYTMTPKAARTLARKLTRWARAAEAR